MPAREFVGRALEFIPSDFGRLVLLGSIQTTGSSLFSSAVEAMTFDPDELKRALQHFHREAFHSWLGRDRTSRADDVRKFCQGAGASAREMAAEWIVRADYSDLVPATASPMERERFRIGLDLALATAYAALV
jgi:hypothetical protein